MYTNGLRHNRAAARSYLLPCPDLRAGETSPPLTRERSARDRTTQLYAFLEPPGDTDEIGRLGPYRVHEVVGSGGMGWSSGPRTPASSGWWP